MRFESRKGYRLGTRLALSGLIVAALVLSPSSAGADPFPSPSSSTTVGATVDPSFFFAVAGLNSGACNGASITGTGSSASAVSLGRVDKTSSAIGAQTLSVGSNAGSGYSVVAHVDGALSDGQGHSIATLGSTSTAPSGFAGPGTEAFGYTTSSLLPGPVPDRFFAGGAKWAGIDTSDRPVMYSSTTTNNSTACVAYQITISKDTVGGFYGNNVVYTAIPAF